MTEPLALVFYEKLLPGTRLVNLLESRGYRVETSAQPHELVERARDLKPMVLFAELQAEHTPMLTAITQLRASPETSHIPVVGFSREVLVGMEETARKAGVTFYVSEAAITNHLAEVLEQALRVD